MGGSLDRWIPEISTTSGARFRGGAMHRSRNILIALALALVVVPFISSTAQADSPKHRVVELP
jgi:hypothetical protein